MQWGLIMAQIFEQLFKQGSTIIWKYNIIFFCTIDIDTMNDIFIDRKKCCDIFNGGTHQKD